MISPYQQSGAPTQSLSGCTPTDRRSASFVAPIEHLYRSFVGVQHAVLEQIGAQRIDH
jgi:hypothetical protein